jgi:hypothetical protein
MHARSGVAQIRHFNLSDGSHMMLLCNGANEELHGGLKDLLARFNFNDYVESMKVFAVKPRPPTY